MAGKIYITGDCHGDFRKFNTHRFPIQRELDKEDYLIICGDFGGIWNQGWESGNENYWLTWLDEKPYTTLFVDGNHENFKRLKKYPVKEWKGGLVHEIRPSVLHLMRGYVFELAGKKIFAFGGACSHDIEGGVLDPKALDFAQKKKELNKEYKSYRIKNISWWEEELPSDKEYTLASQNLAQNNLKIDYVISHCCASSTQNQFNKTGEYKVNALTNYFDEIKNNCDFNKWYFGHYHEDRRISDKEVVLYNQIVKIGENPVEKNAIVGYPKYKREDWVDFIYELKNGDVRLEGKISGVDADGTFLIDGRIIK